MLYTYIYILNIICVGTWYINDTGALRRGSKLLLSLGVWMVRGKSLAACRRRGRYTRKQTESTRSSKNNLWAHYLSHCLLFLSL